VTQPLCSDGNGHVEFYAAQGLYTILYTSPQIQTVILPDQCIVQPDNTLGLQYNSDSSTWHHNSRTRWCEQSIRPIGHPIPCRFACYRSERNHPGWMDSRLCNRVARCSTAGLGCHRRYLFRSIRKDNEANPHQHSTVRGGVSQQPVSNSEQTAG
jgi:hypothetical protein